jgi:hypothetical protein
MAVLTPLLTQAHEAYTARKGLAAIVRAADAAADAEHGHSDGEEEEGGDDSDEDGSGSDDEDDDDDDEEEEEEEEESDSDDSANDDYRMGSAYEGGGGRQVAPGGGAVVMGSTAEAAPGAGADPELAAFEALLRPWRVASPLCKGTSLFAIGCQMNHSCTPNVQVCYARGDSVGAAVAQCDIAAGTELCINYVGLRQGYADRQADLRHYGFVCACPRCVVEAAEEGSDGEDGSGSDAE